MRALLPLAVATLLSGCPAPMYAPTPCTTTADCGPRSTCVSGYCSVPSACGNGRCDGGESIASCPSDCTAARCGDGTCDAGESLESCVDCIGTGSARTYVVSTIETMPPADPSIAFGYDLDAMEGGAAGLPCTAAPDFTSVVTGDRAVDNQFGTVVPVFDMMLSGGLDGVIREEIQSGALLYVIEVGQIDGFVDDGAVLVHVVLGQPAPGTTLATSGTGLAEGAVLEPVADLGTVEGTIVRGRLRAAIPALPLSFSVSGTLVTLTLRGAVIGGRITESGAIVEGEIGGTISVDDVLRFASAFLMGVDRSTIEALAMPDMTPDRGGEHCAGISFGFGFTSVTATLE